MKFIDRKSCVLFENQKGEILLQKRNEEPEIDKWVPFGGSIEANETEKEAAKREILEELDYEVKEINLFKKNIYKKVEQIIFIAKDQVTIDDLELHEGSDMKFFSPSELGNIEIGFNYRKVLADYIKDR